MADDTELTKHGFDYAARDKYYWDRLEQLKAEEGMSLQDMLMNWPSYVRRRELPRFLAHYEMFKHVIDLSGCIVECGVFKGASFFTWTKLLETFCPGDRYRRSTASTTSRASRTSTRRTEPTSASISTSRWAAGKPRPTTRG